MNDTALALALSGICKAYASPVLRGVDLQLRAGEVHALVGANGAGKSTLARIVTGLARPDAGAMLLNGEPYAPAGKADAEAAGVHIVQQELNLLPTLTVGENLFLSRLPRRMGFVSRPRLREASVAALASVGLQQVDPDTPVASLGIGQQQLVEIASALSRTMRVLILDEPTAALTRPEVDVLFTRIRELRARGVALIYISHRMEEIREIADRVSVLRDGELSGTRSAVEATHEEILDLMLGGVRAKMDGSEFRGRSRGRLALRVSGLCAGPLVRNFSIDLHAGEIVGLSGLVGSGRTETLRAIFGADPIEAGSIAVGDPPRAVRVRSPRKAVRAGIGMLPEDRKSEGLLLSQSISANMTLARISEVSGIGGRLAVAKERRIAEDLRRETDLRCDHVLQPAQSLSGGNQQKVLLARWLLRDCDVLLCDEPTRGIDVGARATIYARLHALACAGKALLVASSDLEELMMLCDRIVVISAGQVAGEFPRDQWTEEAIMAAAFSGYLGTRRQADAKGRTGTRG